MYGDVTEAKLGYILRDHDTGKLQFKKDNLLHIACYLNGKYGPGTVEVEIKDSYRNMLEKIKPHFHLVENARKAIEKAGLTPEEVPCPRRHRWCRPELEGPALPQPGHRRLQLPRRVRVHHRRADGQGNRILLNIVELYSLITLHRKKSLRRVRRAVFCF